MADPNEVGTVKIGVEADTSGLKASLQDAKNEAEKLGDASDKASAKIDKNVKKSAKNVEKFGAGLSKLQEAFSKLIIPVALIGGITSLITKMIDLRKEAEKFREKLDEISDISARRLEDALITQNFDELGREIAKLEQMRRDEVDKTNDIFAEKTRSTLNALRSGLKDITGIDLGFDREDAAEAAKEAEDRINRNYDGLIKSVKDTYEAQRKEQERIIKEEEATKAARQAEELAALEKRLRIEAAAAAERNAAQIAAAEQSAQAFADKFDQVFGADFTTRLDTIAAALNRGNNAIGRLK
jgi:hypothetical protein